MISLQRVKWGAVHDAEILAAMHGDPLASLAEFRGWVSEGAAILWDFHSDGQRIGCALVTAVRLAGHNQAVIVAGHSQATTAELRQAMRLLVEQLQGFDSIRTHIQRPGLARLWRRLGFEQTEIVMRRTNG